MLHHVDPSVKLSILKLIIFYELLLTINIQSGLYPMNKSIARTDNPHYYEYRSGYNDEPSKFAVWSMEYVLYFSQNMKVFTDLTKKTGIGYDVSAKIIKFVRF